MCTNDDALIKKIIATSKTLFHQKSNLQTKILILFNIFSDNIGGSQRFQNTPILPQNTTANRTKQIKLLNRYFLI